MYESSHLAERCHLCGHRSIFVIGFTELATQLVDDNSLDPWARSVRKLFQIFPHDFEAEKEFNLEQAKKDPYCSICSLFRLAQVR